MIATGLLRKFACVFAVWLAILAVATPAYALPDQVHVGHSGGAGTHSVEQDSSLIEYVAGQIVSHCDDAAGHCDFCSLQPKLSVFSPDCSESSAIHREIVGWLSERMFGIYRPPKT